MSWSRATRSRAAWRSPVSRASVAPARPSLTKANNWRTCWSISSSSRWNALRSPTRSRYPSRAAYPLLSGTHRQPVTVEHPGVDLGVLEVTRAPTGAIAREGGESAVEPPEVECGDAQHRSGRHRHQQGAPVGARVRTVAGKVARGRGGR